MRVTEIEGRDLLFQLDDLLSPEECADLIARAHATTTSSDTGNRAWHVPDNNNGNYLRVVMWDQALADRL